jgi:urea transport system substrate-binding protein
MSIISKFKFFTNTVIKGVVLVTFLIVLRKLAPEFIDPITIAILEPSTGSVAVQAYHNSQAFITAVDEINETGYFGFLKGIDRVRTVTISENLKEPGALAIVKQKLLDEDVEAVFGCADSSCVRLVQPLIDELDLPFFYVRPHEGLLDSDNFVFIGPLPNQMTAPAVQWALENLGTRAYIVGSNTVYSNIIGEIVAEEVRLNGGEITGEIYYGLGVSELGALPEQWNKQETDVIFNVAESDTNVSFIKRLSVHAPLPGLPEIFFLDEDRGEVSKRDSWEWEGYYIASTYNYLLETEANKEFLSRWEDRMGGALNAGASEAGAYSAIKLWFKARSSLRPGEKRTTIDALLGLSMALPMGDTTVGWTTPHINHHVVLYRFDQSGDAKVVWEDGTDRIAIMRPVFKSAEQWKALLDNFEAKTSGKWYSKETVVVPADRDEP